MLASYRGVMTRLRQSQECCSRHRWRAPVHMDRPIACTDGCFSKVPPLALVLDQPITAKQQLVNKNSTAGETKHGNVLNGGRTERASRF